MSEQTDIVRYDASKPPGNAVNLKSLMNSPAVLNSLREVVAKTLTPERVVKMLVFAASKNPRLYQCTPHSLLKAAMTSAEVGLDCSGTLGRAYLVPYGSEATFIPGYLGLADLARRSGEIESMDAQVVYKGEKFNLTLGLNPSLIHEPDLFAEKKDEDIVGAYFVAKFKAGGTHLEWMNRSDIEKIRKRSKAANNGPWVTDYAAMCRKTVLRRGIKFCPLSVESQSLIAKAEEDEFDEKARPVVEMGTLSIEDLQPVTQEEPPIDVTKLQSIRDMWQMYKLDLKRKKLSKDGFERIDQILAEEYTTNDLAKIAEIADPDTFAIFLEGCTRTLEEEFIK